LRSRLFSTLACISIGTLLCAAATWTEAAEEAPARRLPTRVCAEQNISVPFPEMAAALGQAAGDRDVVDEARRWFCSRLQLNPDIRRNAGLAEHFDNFGAGVVLEYLDRRSSIGIKELEITTISLQFRDARCSGDGRVLFPKAKAAAAEYAVKVQDWAGKVSKLDPGSHTFSGRAWAAEKDFKVSKNFAELVYLDFCLASVKVAKGSEPKLKKLDDESRRVLSYYIQANTQFAPLLRPDALAAIQEVVSWNESEGRK